MGEQPDTMHVEVLKQQLASRKAAGCCDGNSCATCLLIACVEVTNDPSQTCFLQCWQEYLIGRGVDFSKQQDSVEVLQLFFQDRVLDELIANIVTVKRKSKKRDGKQKKQHA